MGSSGARLEVVSGNAAGTELLIEDELIVGRHADGPGRLAGDEEISRSHARLSIDASGFCAIEDLGSTNGTFVNGLRISAPETLSEGDTIEVGATTLVVQEVPIPVSQATPSDADQPTVAPPTEPSQPPLELQLEVDFAAREARLRLDDASEPVRLVFDDGQWRAVASQSTEKGDPA
jgi:pSer/pThr/pTyr-binding forkhead associated (FHA) protein